METERPKMRYDGGRPLTRSCIPALEIAVVAISNLSRMLKVEHRPPLTKCTQGTKLFQKVYWTQARVIGLPAKLIAYLSVSDKNYRRAAKIFVKSKEFNHIDISGKSFPIRETALPRNARSLASLRIFVAENVSCRADEPGGPIQVIGYIFRRLSCRSRVVKTSDGSSWR
jgi:hypothetical protein